MSPAELDYWAAIRYAERAAAVAEELATMVLLGEADRARDQLAKAIDLLLSTMDHADDATGALDDLAKRLLSTHAEACRQAPGDPVALADWLLHTQFDTGRWRPIDISSYATALGDAGLSRYRTAVQKRWADDPADLSARDAVEQLARWEHDVETLVRVIGGDLRHPAQFGMLARALAEIGEIGLAGQWAQRGLREHPDDPPGAGLRRFLTLHRHSINDGLSQRS